MNDFLKSYRLKGPAFNIFLAYMLSSCHPDKLPFAYEGEYQRLLKETKLEARFKDYHADFHSEKRRFDFIGKDGPFHDSIWVIMDGKKYVALYFAQDKPYLDVFAANPETAPITLDMPVRHHNSTLLGTRLSTSAWYDKWELSGDEHFRGFSGSGDSLTLTETQEWKMDGTYQREAVSSHRFTFKVDPFLGYVVDIKCMLKTNDSSQQQIELMNFMPRDVVNPWPNEQRYTYTVFSTVADSNYTTYTNNLLAGNLADETKTDWGKGFEVNNGGFTGMVGQGQYSPLLFRWGNVRFVHRTCDAWLDLHQNILLPKPDEKGGYEVQANYLFTYVPPVVSSYILAKKKQMEFNRKSAVMIPLGVKEDFEKQPIPIDHVGIGLTKGFWQKDFEIDSTVAFSGVRAMRMRGKSLIEIAKSTTDFIRYPQIPLKAKTTYRLEVMAKASSIDAEGWIEASTYEWTPYDTTRLARYHSEIVMDTTWQPLTMEFTTPDFDPFVDIRFRAKGNGYIFFDDFLFEIANPD